MKRRILAILLASLMVMSVLPLSIFAEEPDVHTHDDAPAEAVCPGTGERHTLENCDGAVAVETVETGMCDEPDYTVYKCPVCGDLFVDSFGETENHNLVPVEAKEPTCTAEGNRAYWKCTKCNALYWDNDWSSNKISAKDVVREKTEHKWKTKTENGKNIKTCEVCGTVETEDFEEHEHVWSVNPEIVKAPTYKDTGIARYTCERCGITKDVVIEAACDHQLKEHKRVEATCTDAGSIEYWECTVCGKYFTTKNADVEVAKKKDGKYDTAISAKGHKQGDLKGHKEPTCTEAGYNEYECSVCKKLYREEIKAKGHSYAKDPTFSRPATCTTWGFDVYACTVCGMTKEIESTPPLGHTGYDEKDKAGNYVSKDKNEISATCTQNGKRTWKCGRCDAELSEAIPALGHETKTVKVAATCKRHNYEFTYCTRSGCDGKFDSEGFTYKDGVVTSEKDNLTYDVTVNGKAVKVLSFKLGTDALNPDNHKFIVVEEVVSPTCTESGLALKYCEYCNAYETSSVPAKGHKWSERPTTSVEATCQTRTGYDEYTCVTCHETERRNVTTYTYKMQYNSLDEAQKAHPGMGKASEIYREGDCEHLGLLKYKCGDCGKDIFVVEEGTGEGHKPEVTKKAKDPTCTEDGCTEEVICSVCKHKLKESEVKKALGHDYVNVPAVPATCTKGGVKAYKYCKRCNDTNVPEKERPTDPLGHDYRPNASRTASCLDFGFTHFECPRCHDEVIRNYVPARGHTMPKAPQETTYPTCEGTGKKTYKCTECGAIIKEEEIPATGHKNKGNKTFYNKCTDTETDRYCTVCEQTIGKEHHYANVAEFPASCEEYGYLVWRCPDCGDMYVENIEAPIGYRDYVWTADKDADTHTGVCQRCGKTVTEAHNWSINGVEIDHVNYICLTCRAEKTEPSSLDILLSAENRDFEGAAFTDGSVVALTVSLRSRLETGTEVWGISFNVNYDADHMKFVGYDFVSELIDGKYLVKDNVKYNTEEDGAVRLDSSYVSVMAQTPDENQKAVNATITDETALVVLYFEINSGELGDGASDMWTFFNVENASAVTADGTDFGSKIEWLYTSGTGITIYKLLDANHDGYCDMQDLLYVYQINIGAIDVEYDAIVDVNKDGFIDSFDLYYLYQYMIGAIEYEDLVALASND